MGTIIQFILIMIVAIILWGAYHSIFNVVYFDAGKGCIREVAACFCIAVLIVGFLGNIFFAILPYLLGVGVIVGIILLIRKITKRK